MEAYSIAWSKLLRLSMKIAKSWQRSCSRCQRHSGRRYQVRGYTMFSRRKFFGLLGGVVAAKVAAPIYVLAPPCGWGIANGLYTTYLLPQDLVTTVDKVLASHARGKWLYLGEVTNIQIRPTTFPAIFGALYGVSGKWQARIRA
jgi:hypothetical protein